LDLKLGYARAQTWVDSLATPTINRTCVTRRLTEKLVAEVIHTITSGSDEHIHNIFAAPMRRMTCVVKVFRGEYAALVADGRGAVVVVPPEPLLLGAVVAVPPEPLLPLLGAGTVTPQKEPAGLLLPVIIIDTVPSLQLSGGGSAEHVVPHVDVAVACAQAPAPNFWNSALVSK